jgi:hypothetical protein
MRMLHKERGQGHGRKRGISPIIPRFMAKESTPTKEENLSNVNNKEKKYFEKKSSLFYAELSRAISKESHELLRR